LLFAENAKGQAAAATTVECELPQGTIQDLVHGMTIFVSKTGIEQAKLQEIQDFVNAYKLAQGIHLLHMQLESGHILKRVRGVEHWENLDINSGIGD
jgi:hypothetical protein